MKKLVILSAVLLLAACQREEIPGAIYKQQELNTVSEGVLGTVQNKRNVRIKIVNSSAQQPAVIQVADGKGGVMNVPNPNGLQSSESEVPGYEYVVKLDAGKLINVTQSDDGSIDEDDKVYVFQYPDGKTRIVPAKKKFLGVF